MITNSWLDAQKTITEGGVAIIPTDTIYGLAARFDNQKALDKINRLKSRNPEKPYVVLIDSKDKLKLFNIEITPTQNYVLDNLWPGPFSIGFNSNQAFRLPKSESLINFLQAVGPIVATSCNQTGKLHATTIKEAWDYFGNEIDCYVKNESEPLLDQPSTVITLNPSGQIEVIRQGLGIVPENLLIKQKNMKDYISYDDFSKLDLRIGTIISGETIPKSTKLLDLEISIGENEADKKHIIAGIGESYSIDQLIGRQVLIIINLEPRSLMGRTSEGMILAANGDSGPIVLNPEKTVLDGALVK